MYPALLVTAPDRRGEGVILIIAAVMGVPNGIGSLLNWKRHYKERGQW